MYPTPAMITFVDRLGTLFSGIFEGIIHMPHVLARLCKCADDSCTLLRCKEVKCSLWLEKYGKVVYESMNISCFEKIPVYKSIKRKWENVTEKCLSWAICKYVKLCKINLNHLSFCHVNLNNVIEINSFYKWLLFYSFKLWKQN